MPEKITDLVASLKKLKEALDEYLDDTELSGVNAGYDPEAMAPIPRRQPRCDTDSSEWTAWLVKAAVIDVQREYASIGYCQEPTEEGCPLPDDHGGLTLWKKFLLHSRNSNATTIHDAGLDFRSWVAAEVQRQLEISDEQLKLYWDKVRRTLYSCGEPIRPVFRKNAKRAMCVLDAFQEEHWPGTIDCPISTRLDRVLDNMNKGLRVIEFFQEAGGDQIGWRKKSR